KSELQDSVRNIIRVILLLLAPITVLLMWRSMAADEGNIQTAVSAASGAVIGMIPAGMFLLTSVALAVSMMRLAKKKTLVKDLFGIEMLARVNVLCLDKTGTITDGTMTVNEIVELNKHTEDDELTTAQIIGNLLTATGDNNQTALAFVDKFGYKNDLKVVKAMPFSSVRKLSAATFEGHGTYVLGAPEFVIKELGVRISKLMQDYAKNGYRVMLLAHATGDIKDDKLPAVKKPLAIIAIEDHIRKDAPDTIKWFRENNVAVKVISGDNAITVSEVAKRAGVERADMYVSLDGMSNQEVIEAASKYTVFGRVSPEQKSLLIKALKAKGNTVAMTGDGINDLLAMREADCSIAIASGSEAARKVSHLVLSDNSFSTMPEVVKEGRRVVNNIQKSSTLFLMKTFMSLGLALITIVRSFIPGGTMDYPFETHNLLLLEMFIIGIPSFFLALQTNKNIITGRFIFNIIQKSIPSGLALIINIMAVYVFAENMFAPGTPGSVGTPEFTTMIVMALTFTGMIMLVKLAEPLDMFRGILVVACNLACFLILFIAPWIVGATYINNLQAVMILFVISMVLASYFMVAVIIKLLSKIKIYT
ncbi:MAG: HAD-IC family P-type ATPase, partial [Firmicutes bacterium]|nr:HAD-IC family P-type ATPase [Bacillota bacterium]